MSTRTIGRSARQHRRGTLGRLAEIRHARRLSQHDLSDISGVPVVSISRAENGNMPVSITVYKLAMGLGVDPGELYTRVEENAM